MKTYRLFNFIIAVALLLVVGLTIREAAATTVVAARNGSVETTCASLPSRFSIHYGIVDGRGGVTSTEAGPTGVDGGLIQLMSDYRTCSK